MAPTARNKKKLTHNKLAWWSIFALKPSEATPNNPIKAAIYTSYRNSLGNSASEEIGMVKYFSLCIKKRQKK